MTTRGQSEVIGLILLTAIVIVAVTFVGTLFLDNLNRSIENQEPNVDIKGELNGSNAIITHQGGDDLPFSKLELRLRSDGNERVYALSDAGDINATEGDGDEIFESGEKVIVDHDFTGDVRILLAETTDPGYVLFDETLTIDKTGPKTEPTIEKFEITDTSNDPDASFDVTWNASDLQGDITEVTTKLINDGVVEDSNTTSFSNVSATGVHTDSLINASGSGTSYKIQLIVTDAQGNTVAESKAANAATQIGLRPPVIEQFDISDKSTGQDAIFYVTHNATDPDGDITELVVTLSDEDTGTEVENATYLFNQTGVTGETTDRLDDTTGKNKNEVYRINISVKDAEGNIERISVTDTADGDDVATGPKAPVIESFNVTVNCQGNDAQYDLSWNVSDSDGNLDNVTVEWDKNNNGNYDLVEERSISGSVDKRTYAFSRKNACGKEHGIRITVQDEDGNTASANWVGTA